MKNIVMYFDSMAPAGGVERVISNLANEWCNHYNITIIIKDKRPSFYPLDSRIKLESLDNELRFNAQSKLKSLYYLMTNMMVCQRRLKSVLLRLEPDYIYCASPQVSFEIAFFCRSYLKKLVVSEHASKNAPNFLFQMMKKYAYPKAYVLSVPTKMDTDEYIKEGYPAIYIPHTASYQHQVKTDLSSKVVLNVGRYTADKQQMLLLEIWNIIQKKYGLQGWKLWFYGKGEDKEALLNKVNELGLNTSVKFHNPTNNIHEVYQNASIFAFTSRMEGFGMVLLEAMAFGLPCLSFDCPSGSRDIITDEVNGYLVHCFDKNAYAEKLYQLISCREKIKKMSDQAYDTVENWDKDEILNKWYEIFK